MLDEVEGVAGAADSDLDVPTWRTELPGSDEDGAGDEDEWEDEDDDAFAIELPVLGDGEALDVQALAALPTSLQLQLIQRFREQRSAANRERLQSASDAAPGMFSSLQLESYLANGRVKRQLDALVRENAGGAEEDPMAEHMRAQRIAGDTARRA